MINVFMCLRGKEYSTRRDREKKIGKLKAEIRKLREEICWLNREIEKRDKIPF